MDKRIFAKKKRRGRRLGRWTLGLMAVLILAWAAGLAGFVLGMPEPVVELPLRKVDGIVVLTGSGGRINAGLKALRGGLGERMLITGVNPEVATETLRSAIGAGGDLFDCCVDLGREAADTNGNALETRSWADRHGFKSLEIITTDLHMRRSMLVFRRAMPGITLYAHATPSDKTIFSVAREYTKFLVAAVF